ncbi:MAG: hypothetical protein ACYTBJ_00370 [Planctomycetota bacterium]|jgi:hypothetical protein
MDIKEIVVGEMLYVNAGALKGHHVVVLSVHPRGLPTLAGTQSPPCIGVRFGDSDAAERTTTNAEV